MAAELEVGTLAGRIEFEDKMSSTVDLLLVKIDNLESKFGSMGQHVAESAAGFITAEAAIGLFKEGVHLAAETIKELSIEGAGIADVEENFNRLATGAGRVGEVLIGSLREGTHSTITDFELMKTVNQDLAAGMNLSENAFKQLSDGAFALAQATGGDVKSALDTVNDAMLTGRTRALQMLTGKIDLAGAEDKYAASLGTTADRLSAEGKLESARAAILESVGKATQRLGEQTDGLDEKVAQVQTSWNNWWEDLSKAIGTSPAVIHAFETVKASLVGAFGGDTNDMLESVVVWVDKTADAVSEYAPIVVSGFVSIKDWVLDVYHTVIDTWNALPDWMKNVAEKTALTVVGFKLLEVGAKGVTSGITDAIGVIGNLTTTFSGMPVAFKNITDGLGSIKLLAGLTALEFTSLGAAKASLSLLAGGIASTIGPLGMATAYAAALYGAYELGKWQPISDFFQNMGLILMGYSSEERAAMIATDHLTQEAVKQAAATKVQDDAAAQVKSTLKALNDAQAEAAKTTGVHNDALDKSRLILTQTSEEAKKYAEALREMNAVAGGLDSTLNNISGEVVEAIKFYLEAGIAQDKLAAAYGLTASQVGAVADARKQEIADLKIETDAADDLAQMYIAYYAKKAQLGATDGEKSKVNAQQEYDSHVAALQAKGVKNVEYYNALWDLREKTVDLDDQARLANDSKSRDNLLGRIANETEYYQFMLEHSNQYTAADIANQKKIIESLKTMRDHWGQITGKIDQQVDSVRTLSGEIITLTEAERRRNDGGSFDVTSQNFEETLRGIATANGRNPTGTGSTVNIARAYDYARNGYSFQEIMEIFDRQRAGATGAVPPPHGPRIPGFSRGVRNFGGGEAWVGEQGPELVSLPPGSGVKSHEESMAEQYAIGARIAALYKMLEAAQEALGKAQEGFDRARVLGDPDSSKSLETQGKRAEDFLVASNAVRAIAEEIKQLQKLSYGGDKESAAAIVPASGPASAGAVLTFGAGAIQINNPIMRDKQQLAEVGDMIGAALVEYLASKGVRMGQR